MAIEQIFDSASSVMTVISFTTFLGILLWTYALKRGADFDAQAALPFADEPAGQLANAANEERGHG